MKKLLLAFLFLFCFTVYSNAAEPAPIIAPATNSVNNYLLYPTSNIYTFLKLDTRNGRIWQVQYSLDDQDIQVDLNSKKLVVDGKPGQFALYPTTNIWTFLLLDTINGNVWHVQWSTDPLDRCIIPIRHLN